MIKRCATAMLLAIFLAGTLPACVHPRKVPPGQMKKQLAPGHLKKHH